MVMAVNGDKYRNGNLCPGYGYSWYSVVTIAKKKIFYRSF